MKEHKHSQVRTLVEKALECKRLPLRIVDIRQGAVGTTIVRLSLGREKRRDRSTFMTLDLYNEPNVLVVHAYVSGVRWFDSYHIPLNQGYLVGRKLASYINSVLTVIKRQME